MNFGVKANLRQSTQAVCPEASRQVSFRICKFLLTASRSCPSGVCSILLYIIVNTQPAGDTHGSTVDRTPRQG